jgi:hypothetical protein
MIGVKLCKKIPIVLMSSFLSKHINGLKIASESERSLEVNIQPLASQDLAHEIVHWVHKIAERVSQLEEGEEQILLCKRLARILLTVLFNIEKCDDEFSLKVHEALFTIMNTYFVIPLSGLLEAKTASELNAILPLIIESPTVLEEMASAIDDRLVKVHVTSDTKLARGNNELSDKAYNQEMALISRHINFRKKLLKLLVKKNAEKMRNRILSKPFSTNFILDFISKNKIKPEVLRKFLVKTNIHIETFTKLGSHINQLIKFESTTVFNNAIEIYTVSSMLQNLINCGRDYVGFMVKAMSEPEYTKELHKVFATAFQLEESEKIMKEFKTWNEARILANQRQEYQGQKKKLTRAKWQEEAFMFRMQKLAKKRRGMKKQQMLEDKAHYIKAKF